MEDDSIITEMLDRIVIYPYRATNLVTLEDKDFIIHLCLHLYKEATTSEWVFRRKDLNLYKFNDIYVLLVKYGSIEMYKELAKGLYTMERKKSAILRCVIQKKFIQSLDKWKDMKKCWIKYNG